MKGIKPRNTQSGQSMVEYVVILMALSAALLTANYTAGDGTDLPMGYIGTSEAEQGSLIQAINMKHRGHNYALSLSQIPDAADCGGEMNDGKPTGVAAFYESLEKYPELSPQLRSCERMMARLTSGINRITSEVSRVSSYIPPRFPPSGFPPSFPPSGFPF